MTIDTIEWKKFRVGDLFDIHPTKAYKLTNHDLFDDGDNPVVVNSAFNNGIGGYTTQPCTEKGNIVTFSDTTTADAIFYQKSAFVGYPHVQGMYPRGLYADKWNSNTLKFFTTVFHRAALSGTIDYVNKFTREIASQLFVKLPVTSAGAPDWSYMEEYMRGIQSRADAALDTLSAVCSADDIGGGIETREWKKFYLMHTDNHDGLFECSRGMRLTKTDRIDGDIPLLTAGIGVGQGIAQYIAPVESMQLYREDITVDMFGEAFVHDYPHYGDDNIHFMTNDEINKACKLYICSVINRQTAGVYSYTKQFRINTLKDMTISLPVTPSGTPDWDYMEEYMRRIEKRAEQALDTLSAVEQVAV